MWTNRTRTIAALVLMFPGMASSQPAQQKLSLVINGHSGQAITFQINGKSYIDLESLVRIANGSMSFRNDQIILTIPAASESAPVEPSTNSGTANPGMSSEFMKAAVRELAIIKDWTSILAYAAQRGVPGDGSRLVILRDRAAEALRLAKVAASSESDQNAFQLLSNHFDNVNTWTDKLVGERRSMDTGKYSMTPDAFANDPTYQKISNCTKFLSAMIPSGQFEDDASCH